MINGKAKIYDTFTPTITCVYNKVTQKFVYNEVLYWVIYLKMKIILTLNTAKRETSLGQFVV
jgi:hypothetical protein